MEQPRGYVLGLVTWIGLCLTVGIVTELDELRTVDQPATHAGRSPASDPHDLSVVTADELATASDSPADEATPGSSTISDETRDRLFRLRREIRKWAFICPDGTMTSGHCPGGDMLEFAGLLCLSGERQRCEDVRKSQDRATGEWYRAPGMVNQLDHGGMKATFSRDMAKGAIAYLVETKDVEAGRLWMNFIEGNRFKLCRKPIKGWDACTTRATFWSYVGPVWAYLGLPKPKRTNGFKYLIERIYSPIELRLKKNDYSMQLTADEVYFRNEIEKRSGKRDPNHRYLRKAARILVQRAEQNPFFRYLLTGGDERTAELIFKYCPSTRKMTTVRGQRDPAFDWMWQRHHTDLVDGTDLKTYEHPSGHECIFAINLLIGPDSDQTYGGTRLPWSEEN